MYKNKKTVAATYALFILLTSSGCGSSTTGTPANSANNISSNTSVSPPDTSSATHSIPTSRSASVTASSANSSTAATSSTITSTATSTLSSMSSVHSQTQPNILLIISDDLGLDASAQYNLSNDLPITPTLDELASTGIVFDNAWATPACTTTRGSLITGQHGTNSGVDTVPNLMDSSLLTLQRALSQDTATQDYASAVIGKWHLAGPGANLNHPIESGANYYSGNIAGTIEHYEDWTLTQDAQQSQSTIYHSTAITDSAINWIDQQTSPWFLWLAYVAPHSPYHLPPQNLHTRTLSGSDEDIAANKRDYYLAAIEAMDAEIGRLLETMTPAQKANTLILYVGDNGTPSNVVDASVFGKDKVKNTLYEGAVRVPMLASGAGVSRFNQRESALINTVDFYPSILAAAGAKPVTHIDGSSFYELLGDNYATATTRNFNYTEFISNNVSGWAVRNAQYKLIEFADGSQELYDVINDIAETSNLIANGVGDYSNTISTLSNYAATIRGTLHDTTPSTDHDDEALDISNALLTGKDSNCAHYVKAYRSDVTDIAENIMYEGSLSIAVDGNECVLITNAIPNHNFNDGSASFPNLVSAQNDEYRITTEPQKAASVTALGLSMDNALLLNGVKVDLLAAACFNVGNEKVGCNDIDQPWRFDPMFSANGFRVDSHNAHTQPDGTYHYHGKPNALFDDTSEQVVVGFAADGFPIFGSYFNDGTQRRKALSSYQLKAGARPNNTDSPGGNYDGSFRDDYEYIPNAGDLDECNGMTINNVYGYYITDEYPYILGCFSGTPHSSFNK